jgi:hypothetical protein
LIIIVSKRVASRREVESVHESPQTALRPHRNCAERTSAAFGDNVCIWTTGVQVAPSIVNCACWRVMFPVKKYDGSVEPGISR